MIGAYIVHGFCVRLSHKIKLRNDNFVKLFMFFLLNWKNSTDDFGHIFILEITHVKSFKIKYLNVLGVHPIVVSESSVLSFSLIQQLAAWKLFWLNIIIQGLGQPSLV